MNKKRLFVWACFAAANAAAETRLLSEFIQGTTVESSSVRLEARVDAVAAAVFTGAVTMPSPDGASSKEWDASSVANGWHEVSDGGETASLLVLNPPGYAVEGGRIATDTSWTADSVHWVRNWVVVPNGVTLTVKEGTVVKFGEATGIKVENGGVVDFQGKDDSRIVLTHFADDSDGGDSDFGKTNAVYGCWSVIAPSGGTVNDVHTHVRYGRMEMLPTLSMPDYVIAQRVEGRALIPVTVSGTRMDRLSLHWRVIEETARCGTDFEVSEGEAEWAGVSASKVYFEIPLVRDAAGDEVKTFRVEVVSVEDANPDPRRLETTVAIVSGAAMPVPACASSDSSEAVRLENRATNTLGHASVVGSEWKAADGGSRAESWDTTSLGYGWQTLSDGHGTNVHVLALNDEAVAVEGGRLAGDVTWGSNAVHLVRNTVVVPSGIKLTVVTNAVVKFCENTGVKVEAGGRLELLGSADENVYLTLANDDTVGGDTDRKPNREWPESAPTYAVTIVSGGAFADANAAFRGTSVETFGYASTSDRIVADAADGKVRIPVVVTGSRSTPFSVDWKTSDGNAGRLVWNSAAEGTKWAVLDVADCSESFTFELCECRGVNIDGSAKASEVTVYRSAAPFPVCAESEPSEAVRCETRAATTLGGALCCGTEWKSANADSRAVVWDTTQEVDDWVDLGKDMKLLVRNDAGLVVEGGRLTTSAAWTKDVVHVVRNWVVVPSGVTLTIEAGTVVKFAEHTGFKVENGGRINVAGTVAAPVVYTSAADDTIGGDTDRREKAPSFGDYAVDVVSGGTYADSNCAIRYATFSNFGTAALPASAVAGEKGGIVRVPVRVDTSRTTAFCVDWRVASGTYATAGRLSWNTYAEGTKCIEIPLTPGTVADEFDEFEIELFESQGINVSTEARTCSVRVYSDSLLDDAAFAESGSSGDVRLEARDVTCDFGARIVTRTELKSPTGEDAAVAWDTTGLADGWTDVSDGAETLRLLVRNDPSIAIEGGRLEESTTWSRGVTHVVRNWVVVPNGCKLTIPSGSVVKFCENTGIKVEAGGRLDCVGNDVADVVFTSVNDDTVGGDTDLFAVSPAHGNYRIDVVSGGAFTDVCTQMRYGECGMFGTASVAAKVVAKKDGGVARVPILVESSRTTAFAVDWVAHDGTAAFGEDYLSASGRVTWASASAGTGFLEIPLERLSSFDEVKRFTVELTAGLGINLDLDRVTCEVELYDTRDALVGGDRGYAESSWCGFAALDSDAGRDVHFVYGEEPIAYSTRWDAGGTRSKVTLADAENNVTVLHQENGVAEGSFGWSPDGYEDGRYDLLHAIYDSEGNVVKSDLATFIVNRNVLRHGGTLASDEIWTADRVHLVVKTVHVPEGVTLTVAPNAIVKLMPGTGIVVATGGMGVGNGAVFTHAFDDTLGGDTFFDGGATRPSEGEYALSGTWEYDEATQYRYEAPHEIGGILSADLHCLGFRTYLVTADVTVPAGKRLTVEAGAKLKFKAGRSLIVAVGGVLDASSGTRAAPIVFTSAAVDPQPGDWRRIAVAGTASFANCRILYASNGSGNDNAGDCDAVCVNGGIVTFVSSSVLHGGKYAVGLQSGHFYMTNSVIADCYCAFRHWVNDEIVNSVVYNCDRLSNNAGQRFCNCIVSGISEAWSSSNIDNVYNRCVLWNPQGHGLQDPPKDFAAGTGNLWADPLFVDPDALDFRLDAKSPCIDAGDGTIAPALDCYNQPRQNIQGVEQTGVPDANGKCPDIGLSEYQPRFAGADVDLMVKSVTVPEKLTVGESAGISWRVANIGSADAVGPWSDKVELVAGDGTVISLGMVLVKGGLTAGGERIVSSTFRIPSAVEGACAIRVTANHAREVYEGTFVANNVLKSNETTLELTSIDFTDSSKGKVRLSPGKQVSYSVSGLPTDGGSLLLHSETGEKFAAYVGFGEVPTSYTATSACHVLPNGDVLVSVPRQPDADMAYLMLSSESDVVNPSLDVTVSEDRPAVYALSKETLPSVGSQSLTIYGIGMSDVSSVELRSDAATLVGSSVRTASDCELSASFDLSAVQCGTYHAVVRTRENAEAVSAAAVVILPVPTAKAELEVKLQAPAAVRQNQWYEAVVTVRNNGDADGMVPIVALSGAGIEFKDPDGGTETYQGVIHLLALPEEGVCASLAPNGMSVVKCAFRLTTGADYRLHARIVDPVDVSWAALYGFGDSESEKDAYAERMDAYFGSAQNFVRETIAFGARVAETGFRPKNATRIYETLIKNKTGVATAVLSGWLVSSETKMPVSGYPLGFAAGLTNDFVYVTTDASGSFVAYDVPTGVVFVASEGGCVKSDGEIDLGADGIRGLRLVKQEIPAVEEEEEPPEVRYCDECDNIRILPLGGDLACMWLDGYVLCVGMEKNGWSANVLLPDMRVSAYDIRAVSPDVCAFVGVAEADDGRQSLVWFLFGKSANDNSVETGPVFVTNVISTCRSVCITSADVRSVEAICSVTTDSETSLYAASMSFEGKERQALKSVSQKSLKAFNPASIAAVLPRQITASLGLLDLSLEIPVADINKEHCCLRLAKCNGGESVKVGLPACDVSISGNVSGESAFRCNNYFYRGSYGESGCTELSECYSRIRYDIKAGIGKGLKIPYIHKFKGTTYAKLRKANFNFNISCGIGADIRYSHAQGRGYAPSDSGPKLVSDYREDSGGYVLYGDCVIAFALGKPEVEASRGRSRKKQDRSFFAMSSPLINANISFALDFNWQNGVYVGSVGSGSISGRVYNWEIHGKFVNDNGDCGWSWGWSTPAYREEYPPKSRTKLNAIMSAAEPVAETDGAFALIVTPLADDECKFSPYGTSSLNDGNGFVFLREERRNGLVSTDVLYYDSETHKVEVIAKPDMDIGTARVVGFENGNAAIVLVASPHKFDKTEDEAFEALGQSKLYVIRHDGNGWGNIEPMQLPENEYVGDIVVSQGASGDKVIAYGAMTVNGESVSHSIRSFMMSEDAVTAPQTIIHDVADEELVSVDVSLVGDEATAVCSFASEEGADTIRCFYHDGTDWRECAVPQMSGKSLVAAKPSKTARSGAFLGNSQIEPPGTTHVCNQTTCSCGCNDRGKKRKPLPTCGCPASCEVCGGNGGPNCRCDWLRTIRDPHDDHLEGTVPRSQDPNEMSGPSGAGANRCVRPGDWLEYTIYFENKSTASAAAQDVYVTLPKDPSLDWDSFELGEIAFGDNVDTALSGKPEGSSEFAVPGANWTVRTVVTREKNDVKWHLRIFDPATVNNYPEDPYAGFLPPNDSSGRGEGHLRYRVKVKPSAVVGSEIRASATIVFDYNDAIETDPAWWNTVAKLLTIVGDDAKCGQVAVDPDWIRTHVGETASDAVIVAALNQMGKNGMRVWESAALGLNPEDPADAFLLDAPQNGDEMTVAIKPLDGVSPVAVWAPVKYRLDTDTTGAGTIVRGSMKDGHAFGVDIGGADDPTGIYRVSAIFADDEGNDFAVVPAANRIGILRKTAASKREIVPVPWTKFAAGAEDIAVSNLVKTAGLAAGDRLYVYDDSAKRYATWELQSDKTWKPVKTVKMVNGKLEVQTADSPEVATVKRGSGVWLERQDASKPIAFVGQYESASAVTPIDGGTSELPKWNLIASPAISNWNLNAICEGVGMKDRIIVPTGKEPRIYTRDAGNTKWGYTAYEANDRGIVKPVRKEDDTVVAPGTGFWYISEGGAPVIKW